MASPNNEKNTLTETAFEIGKVSAPNQSFYVAWLDTFVQSINNKKGSQLLEDFIDNEYLKAKNKKNNPPVPSEDNTYKTPGLR